MLSMEGGENMMESVYYLDEMMRFEQRTIEKKARNVWKLSSGDKEKKQRKNQRGNAGRKEDGLLIKQS
jgi:hypothetical protein